MLANNNTQVRQEPNVIVARGHFKRDRSGRRGAMFPMLYPNSPTQ